MVGERLHPIVILDSCVCEGLGVVDGIWKGRNLLMSMYATCHLCNIPQNVDLDIYVILKRKRQKGPALVLNYWGHFRLFQIAKWIVVCRH